MTPAASRDRALPFTADGALLWLALVYVPLLLVFGGGGYLVEAQANPIHRKLTTEKINAISYMATPQPGGSTRRYDQPALEAAAA